MTFSLEHEESAKVAIIGAGNLGSRHMQALALSNIPLEIEVVDTSKNSLDIAKNRWQEMPRNEFVKSIKFYENLDDLQSDLNVVIVATSSIPRRSIIEKLIASKNVQYLILEKVLFPRLSDFDSISALLSEKNIKAWVNCRRRTVPFYKKIRDIFSSEKNLNMSVSGGNWGLCCNTIHFFDIYQFLSGQKNFETDIDFLDSGFIESKRKGYIEFTGSISFKSPKGILTLTSYKQENSDLSIRPCTITLQSENFYCVICENEESARLFLFKDNVWQWENLEVKIKYQSQATQEVVEDLVKYGKCDLPTYEDSAQLHKIMLTAFLNHYNKFIEGSAELCPIT